ncbi:hypothetical protein GC163_06615 [bacterium]|nr:hypothetical protein [bacterium]
MDAVNLFAALGGSAFIIATAKWYFDRKRWADYKRSVRQWTIELIKVQHPKELDDDEWKAQCEKLLVDSRFRPAEIVELLEISVLVAKRIAIEALESGSYI